MTAISNSMAITTNPQLHTSTGSCCNRLDKYAATVKVPFGLNRPGKLQLASPTRQLTVRASYRDDGRPSGASIFVSGFVMGGLIVGALGCVYAPQISRALADTDRKELLRKLPKFIYDEEKILEKKRKILTEKIAQLNDAIDEFSGQLRGEEVENGAAVNSDEMEAAV